MNAPITPLRRLLRDLQCLLAIVGLVFSPACDCSLISEDAAKALVGPLAAAVESAPELLAEMNSLVETAIDKVDDTLAHAIQETSRAVTEQIDAINAALGENIDRVDAVLAARLQQLIDFVHDFNRDLERIIAGTLNQLNFTVDNLATRLQVTGEELLDEAGFTVVRTIEEAGRVVAVVIGGLVETIIIVVGGVVLALSLFFAGLIFFRLARREKLKADNPIIWVTLGFFVFGLSIGIALIASPKVRAAAASGEYPLRPDRSGCERAIAEVALFFSDHDEPLPDEPELHAEALDHYVALGACIASSTAKDLRDRAEELASRLERALGIELHCTKNNDCEAGAHCEVVIGICTTACDVDAECPRSGEVCHAFAGRVCGPPCGGQVKCDQGLKCEDGKCTPVGGTPGGGGPKPGGRFDFGFYHEVVDVLVVRCPKCPLGGRKGPGDVINPGTIDPGTIDPGTIDPGRVDPGRVVGGIGSQPVIEGGEVTPTFKDVIKGDKLIDVLGRDSAFGGNGGLLDRIEGFRGKTLGGR